MTEPMTDYYLQALIALIYFVIFLIGISQGQKS